MRFLAPRCSLKNFGLTDTRAVELAVSVYHIRKINFYSLPASLLAKGTAVFLPAIQQVLLRFTVKYHTVTGYMILADFLRTSKHHHAFQGRLG